MRTPKPIKKAIADNPEIALVLEISARAWEAEQREPTMDLVPTAGVAANPTAAQGSIQLLRACLD
jgi:hypothetical protein